jgi:hypothetical protein
MFVCFHVTKHLTSRVSFRHLLSFIIAAGFYYQQNKLDDKSFEEELRTNYSKNIQNSRSQRADFVKFMDGLKRGESDERLDEMLRAGKGGMKRHYRVDEKYYGTEEGVAAKKRVEEELKEQARKRKERRKKRDAESKKDEKKSTESENPSHEHTSMSTTTKSAVAVAMVGAAAVAVSLLFGGGRRQ